MENTNQGARCGPCGLQWKIISQSENINPLANNGRRILMIVSKKLSNEIEAVDMQPARTSQKTSRNRHSANAPTCTVFVRYEHLSILRTSDRHPVEGRRDGTAFSLVIESREKMWGGCEKGEMWREKLGGRCVKFGIFPQMLRGNLAPLSIVALDLGLKSGEIHRNVKRGK